ncbi:MAG: ethanolamine ammonia-lyase subunit EutB, partial [Pseudomonadota bacterium]
MAYTITIDRTRFAFPDLRTVLAKASPRRSGDELAGVAADGPVERLAAQMALADIPLKDFLATDILGVPGDEVTDLIFDRHDATAFAPVSSLTIGAFREWLLTPGVTGEMLASLERGLTPEMVAGVSKIMRNQ